MSVDAVRIKKLGFAWVPKQPVLHIESLVVPQGEHVYIKGRSGSGKSTLLSLLAGIETRYTGELTLLGQDLSQLSVLKRDQFRADNLGYVFQQFNLLPYLSVLENTLLGMHFSKRKKKRLPTQKKARAEAQSILQSLQIPSALFEQPVYRLSVGQQQRVAAARALLGSPPLILADEPTSALDFETQTAFMQLLFDACAAQQSTLIFVSHDTRLESYFNRVVDLHRVNEVAA